MAHILLKMTISKRWMMNATWIERENHNDDYGWKESLPTFLYWDTYESTHRENTR